MTEERTRRFARAAYFAALGSAAALAMWWLARADIAPLFAGIIVGVIALIVFFDRFSRDFDDTASRDLEGSPGAYVFFLIAALTPLAIYRFGAGWFGYDFDSMDALFIGNVSIWTAASGQWLLRLHRRWRTRRRALRMEVASTRTLLLVYRDGEPDYLGTLHISLGGRKSGKLDRPGFVVLEPPSGTLRLTALILSPVMPAARAEMDLDLEPGAVAVVRVKVTRDTLSGYLALERIDDRAEATAALSALPLAA